MIIELSSDSGTSFEWFDVYFQPPDWKFKETETKQQQLGQHAEAVCRDVFTL